MPRLSDAEFAALYERHVGDVQAYLRRRIGAAAAQDLAGEVFARALRARDRYEGLHATPLPWLLGIATNVVREHRRAERRRLATLERVVRRGEWAAPDRRHEELGPEVARALRRLRADDRDALLLVVWGELTYEETARALDVPVGTVRSRVARARRRLAGELGDIAARAPIAPIKGEEHV